MTFDIPTNQESVNLHFKNTFLCTLIVWEMIKGLQGTEFAEWVARLGKGKGAWWELSLTESVEKGPEFSNCGLGNIRTLNPLSR